ncbi:MAG TPA: DUF664 domain-containing protein [Acidimicrobiales bacterium]|jgi:hypothetical protein
MAFEAPVPAPTADERELLLRYLQRQRAEVIATADGLTDEQARWTPEGALLPIIGIINHLTHVEWRWMNGRYLQQPFPPRAEEFHPDGDVVLADIVEAYRMRGQETDEIVSEASSLRAPCVGVEGDGPPVHEMFGYSEPLDLRWVVLHLIEETAHHAGHADSTRELLDGRRMRG